MWKTGISSLMNPEGIEHHIELQGDVGASASACIH